MPDDGGAVEAPVVEAAESSVEESSQSTPEQTPDKLDGRNQPDALKKRIASLRSQAEQATDPAEKAAILADAKKLNDGIGKVAAYEKVWPTVREAREAKALYDSFGGKDGFATAQQTLANVQAIDHALETGDPTVVDRLYEDAPQGMVKLAPMIFANLEKTNPQEYQKAVVPHAVKFFDTAGFPEAFDQMVKAYQGGDKATGDKLSAELARWFSSQRNQTQQTRVDPRIEQLENQLNETKTKEQQQQIDRAYNSVIEHAGPVIDKHLKPIVGKLGLSAEQYNALRQDAWKDLETGRNKDQTYLTILSSKEKQGYDAVAEYIKSETENRAADSARKRANFWYGHQLKNGAVKTPNVTAQPVIAGVTRGKEPLPGEIDYSAKGKLAAKKAGYSDIADMILSGKAPLKAGGVRQWR